jgi:hypothetical protein
MTERELGQLSWSRPITVVLEEEDGYDERIRSQIYNWMLFSAPEPEGEDKTTITLRKATIKANFPSIHLTVFNRALAALIEEGKATCDNPDARNAEYVFRRSVANLTEVEEDDPPSSSSGQHRIKEGEDSGFDDIGHIAEQENIGKKNVRADKCIKSPKASHKKMKPAKEVDPPPSSPQSAPSSSSSSSSFSSLPLPPPPSLDQTYGVAPLEPEVACSVSDDVRKVVTEEIMKFAHEGSAELSDLEQTLAACDPSCSRADLDAVVAYLSEKNTLMTDDSTIYFVF